MRRIISLMISLLVLGTTGPVLADIPIVSHRYLADPASLVYDGRVYLYCSNDNENPATEDGGYQMTSIVCVSSSDLKNWTDHGIVFQVPRDAAWANLSWAPSAVEKDGTFFLYFGNGAGGIGVATAESPLGPFTDPIGQRLISTSTPGVLPAENMWLFDPMTFIDDDGQAYMYFGGNGEDNLRVIRLNEDLISVNGSAEQFHVPYFFEAAWMHKHNDTYYFSYSTNPNNGMCIDYMTSDNPISGFTYGGVVSPQPPDNYNNNHQAIFEFEGTWYQAYHNRYVAYQEGIPPVYKRNLCLDSIYHKPDGSIQTMVNTADGLEQLGFMNPYERVEAETMDAQNGISTEVCSEGGMKLANIENGDWIKVRGVDFGTAGPAAFTARIASDVKFGSTTGGSIEIRIDEAGGTRIGTVPVGYTGGADVWKSETIAPAEVTGVHDMYFVFTGGDDENLFHFDHWYFTEKTGVHDLLAINATVDDYKIDTVPGYDSTKILVTAVYSDGSVEDVTLGTLFTFDPENVVSISDSIVRGLDYGTVTITANYNDSADNAIIIVKNLASELTVAQIYSESSEIEVFPGSTTSVIIFAEFEDGHVEEVTDEASYSSSDTEIATASGGVISGISEGEADITVTYQGELGEAKSTTIHVNVSSGSGVWLEAECGSVGSLWNIVTNTTASHGEYVTIQTGNNSTDNAPADPSGHLSYTFDIGVSGNYYLYTRVICPSATDDSFWLKMDNGSFVVWNNIAGSSSWIWTYFPSAYNLDAGSHTLTIGYREDGARLDKLWITNTHTELTDQGPDASNCFDNKDLSFENTPDIGLYPNPVDNDLNIVLSDSPSDITILSSDGKVIFNRRTHSLNMVINLGNLDPGVYFVKITSREQTEVREIIKK